MLLKKDNDLYLQTMLFIVQFFNTKCVWYIITKLKCAYR